MIESVLVYFILMSAMVVSNVFTTQTIDRYKGTPFQPFSRLTWFFPIILFAFVFGARYNVGADYLSYLDLYQSVAKGFYFRNDLEPGFVWITRLFAQFDFHYFFYFAFFAFFQLFFIYYAFRKEKYLYPFLSFVIMVAPFLLWMNGIRQYLVFSIFVWLLTLRSGRRYFIYPLVLFLCAFCLHKSAVLLLPVCFLMNIKVDYFKSVIFQIFFILLAIYLNYSDFFVYFLDKIGFLLKMIGYADRYGAQDLSSFYDDYTWGGRTFLKLITCLMIILYSKKMKIYFSETCFLKFYNLFIFGFFFHLVFSGNHLLQRPFEYFSSLQIVVLSYLSYYLYKNFKKNHTDFFSFIFLFLLQFAVFSGTIYSTMNDDDFAKFLFYWQV